MLKEPCHLAKGENVQTLDLRQEMTAGIVAKKVTGQMNADRKAEVDTGLAADHQGEVAHHLAGTIEDLSMVAEAEVDHEKMEGQRR